MPTTDPAAPLDRLPRTDLPLRPELAGIAPYGAPQLDTAVRLNVNENPYPVPETVVADIAGAVTRAAVGLNRYPDREFTALREDLAAYLAVESDADFLTPADVWAANGSNEVMLHLFQAFAGPGRTALSFAPTYSMYPEYARDTATAWVAAGRREDFGIETSRALAAIADAAPSLVLLASPNNPTGTPVDPALIRTVCRATWDGERASAVVVVDEAYAEFRREGTPSALALLPEFPHLAVTRTMSKAFALAGARVGYLAAGPGVTEALRTVRLPYHLSAVTQAVARAALAHRGELLAGVDRLRAERDRLVTWLRALRPGDAQVADGGDPAVTRGGGLVVPDSDANFALFGPLADPGGVWQALVDRGVLVRRVGPEGFLRVTVGTPEETAAFRRALVEVLACPDPDAATRDEATQVEDSSCPVPDSSTEAAS